MMRTFTAVGCVLAAACVHVPPREPTPPRQVIVDAPLERVWDMTIAVLEERNLPLSMRDRNARLLEGERDSLPRTQGTVADCGRALGVTLSPTAARYSFRLHGDSLRTVITMTVTWVFGRLESAKALVCASNGVWEAELATLIKKRAEADKESLMDPGEM